VVLVLSWGRSSQRSTEMWLADAVGAIGDDSRGAGVERVTPVALVGQGPVGFVGPEDREGFRILEAPQYDLRSGWRITWASQLGRLYRLQRWDGVRLEPGGIVGWLDVATVRAEGAVTTAADSTGVVSPKGFYRVALLQETGRDVEGPELSAIAARFAPVDGRPGATLTVQASDPSGVTRVVFLNGSVELGDAEPGEGSAWTFRLPLNVRELGARFLVARAVDGLGNVAHSSVFPLGLVDPDHFLPLGANGLPIEGGIVQAVAVGQWGPVEYRPGGRNLLGQGPGFFVRFPQGVRLITEANGQSLEFTDVVAGFGGAYPIQLDRPLSKTGGALKRLRVGPVSLADVFGIFDRNPAEGVAVTVFTRFPLIWRAGVVDDGGIRAARFSFVSTGLPLPGTSGGYPDLVIDFTRELGMRLPFHGEFSLPDNSNSPLTLKAGAANPLWLTLRPDGAVSLVGPAEVQFPNGGYARVDLNLNEPHYRLHFSADRVRLQALAGLVDLLPANPGVCLPAATTPAQLAEATRCLNALAQAYHRFNGSVAAMVGSGNVAGAAILPAMPPAPFEALSSVLEAWTFTALAGTAQRLPLDLIRDVARQTGQSASSAHDLDTAAVHRLALMRARAALAANVATATAASQAELDAALAEAEAAALARAEDPDATLSFESLTRAVRAIADTEALRQTLNRPVGRLVSTAMPALLQRFAGRQATALGVVAGQFTPFGNPVILGMNRFVAAERVRQLVDFLAAVQLLGVELAASTPIDEALSQLAARLFEVANAAVVQAEQTGDYPGFLLAVQDIVDVVAARELAIFPDNAAVNALLPDVGDLGGYGQRLNTLLQLDLNKPLGERTFRNLSAEIRALLRVLREMPAGVTFASAPFQRAYDGLEAALVASTGSVALASETSLADLMLLLEAGMLHSELGARFGLTASEDWETQRMPRVVGRLSDLILSQRGWSEAGAAVQRLLAEADRLGLVSDSLGRRANLEQAARVLSTSREVARLQIQTSGSALSIADMVLPGEIQVDGVAGAASYHRLTRQFSGRFRGQIALPKFGGYLSVQNASISSGGAFDLNAFGSLRVPVARPAGTLSIPARRPLSIRLREGDVPRFAGAMRLDLDNGMRFEGFLGFEDPVYTMGFAADGLNLELLDRIVFVKPSLPGAGVFTKEVATVFGEYLGSLNRSFESLSGLGQPVEVGEPGVPPEFRDPVLTVPLDGLETFINSAQARLATASAASHEAVFGSIRELLRDVARGVRSAEADLGRLAGDLDLRATDLERTRRAHATLKKLGKVVNQAGFEASIGRRSDLVNSAELKETLDVSRTNTLALLESPASARDLRTLREVFALADDLAAAEQLLGVDGANTVLPKLAGFVQAGLSNHLASLGLNPTNGAVAAPAVFEAMPLHVLDNLARELFGLSAAVSLAGDENRGSDALVLVRSAAQTLANRQRTLILQRFCTEPDLHYLERQQLLQLLDGLNAVEQLDVFHWPAQVMRFGCTTGPFQLESEYAQIWTGLQRVARERELDAQRLTADRVRGGIDPFYTTLARVKVRFNFNLDADVVGPIQRELRAQLQRLDTVALEAWPRDRLRDGVALLDTLADLAEVLESLAMTPEVARVRDVVLPNLTVQFTGAAEAQRAWWEMTDFSRRLIQGVERRIGTNVTILAGAMLSSATATVRAADRVSQAFVALRPQFEPVELRLPGALVVRKGFGSVFYDRSTEFLSGSFGGRLELPAISGALEIRNATVANNGDFDITAFGNVQVPAENPIGLLSIPARRPLHVSFREGEGLRLSGGLRLDLTNGMHFGGFIGLEDPVYTFGLEAGGLKLDLVDKITVLKPTLPGTGAFSREVLTTLTEYYQRLNASFESLAPLTAPLELDPAGTRPEFRAPSVTLEFDAVAAFANSVLAAAEQGRQVTHEAAYGAVRATLKAMADGAGTLEEALAAKLGELDARATDLQRYEDYNGAMNDLARALDRMGRSQSLGNAQVLVDTPEMRAAVGRGRTNTLEILASSQSRRDLPTLRQAARLAFKHVGTEQLLGIEDDGVVFAEVDRFLRTGRTNLFVNLGLSPGTGAVADIARFEAIPLQILDNHAKDLLGYSADLLGSGIDDDGSELAIIRGAVGTLAGRQRSLLLRELCEQPGLTFLDRLQYMRQLGELASAQRLGNFDWPGVVRYSDCTSGPFDLTRETASLERLARRVLEERAREGSNRRLDRADERYFPAYAALSRMKVQFNFNLEADLLAPLRRDLQVRVEGLDRLALETWPRDRMRDGVGMLRDLVELAETLENLGLAPEAAHIQTITLPRLTVEFTAVAEAQKAWWELADFSRRLVQASNRRVGAAATTLAGAFLSAASASVRSADRIAQSFVALRPQFVPQDFVLSGDDLLVRQVFGSLLYDRQTQFLSGTFGGRLEFPSVGTNVFFSINEATLANDGSYTLSASTRTPLPFGQVGLTADLQVASTRAGGLDVLGSGQLAVPFNTTTQLFGVTVLYDESANRLAVHSSAQNVNLRFGEDFVLFDAGFGFDVSLVSPRGRFTAQGSAGMFARSRPLPESISRTNFQVVADGIVTSFAYEPAGTTLSLNNGTLRLPEIFTTLICPTNPVGVVSGPAVALTPAAPISVTFRENPESVRFSGALDFRNLGFEVPGLTNLSAEVCSARLVFPTNGLPLLTNLNATLQLPIPGRTNRVDLFGAAFRLDGFPTGTIALRDNVTVFSQGGFEFILLGTATTNCNLPTALTIARQPNGQPFYRLDGGIEFAIPPAALGADGGGRLFARSCGFVAGTRGEPLQLAMENFAIGGTMRLGGPQGLLIDNAVLALDGLTNAFQPTPSRPFSVSLAGFVNIPGGPRLGLQDARFNFVGETLPRFTIAGMSVAQNPDYEAAPGLLLNVTGASVVFLNPALPFPQVIAPGNIELGISARVNLPPGPNPILSGQVDNLRGRLVDGRVRTEISGFGMSIQNLEFPPLTLTGEVFLGGLDTVNAGGGQQRGLAAAGGRPPGLFFAGRVGGTLNDVGVKALVAFDMNGPIGVCLDASAGPAGIPLGPTGFLLTGAAGGVSFLNSNGDPCDFTTFYPVGADGRPVASQAGLQGEADGSVAMLHQDPVADGRPPGETPSGTARGLARNGDIRPGAAMTWEEYDAYLRRAKQDEATVRHVSAAAERRSLISKVARLDDGPPEFPCPTGDCPPPTVNILCQPHPDLGRFPNKIILKFSSLTEDELNGFGITQSFVSGLGLTDAQGIGQAVAENVRIGIDVLIPRADPALLGATTAAALNADIAEFLNDFESTLAQIVRQTIAPFLGNTTSVYQKIVEAAYAGLPCPDATVKLTGTFSHAAVSTALSATGGIVLSTTGAAGLVGSINVMGVPVGRTESYVAGTDNRGDPNPSFCGDSLLAIGPLELGQMKSKFECPGCVTGVLSAFGQLTGCMADQTLRAVLARVAPRVLDRPTQQALAALNDSEKLAFVGQVFSMPPVPGLGGCFAAAARTVADSFQPSFALCGQAIPKLFGIPLSAELVDVSAAATRTSLAAGFSFSPSFVINNLLLCAGSGGLFCQPIFPALDNASMGFGLGFPDLAEAVVGGFEGKFSSPQALGDFAREGFDHMLANATFTIGYEINPFGFKLADAEARVILPNLTAHPARPGFRYVRPEDRTPALPSRLTVALTALERGFLAQPLWKGTADDLFQIFPEGSPERSQLQQARVNFQTDYFPHGGILGAARLAMPRMIVDAPPLAAIRTVSDPSADVFERLGAAADLIGNYVLQTSEVGSLAFYVPAPNPPFFADAGGNPLSPRDLLGSLASFDPSQIQVGSVYPFEQFFMSGYLDGRLLGVPVGRAEVVAVPAGGGNGPFFRVRAGVPTGSWLRSFLDSANLSFEIRQSPPRPIEDVFTEFRDQITRLQQNGGTAAEVATVVNRVATSLADGLPKVSMDLSVDRFRIPDPLTNLLTTGSASARLVAYSPRFNPAFPGTGPFAEATRLGGIAFKGQFRFANLVTIDNAELAVFPSDVVALPNLAGRFSVPQLGIPGLALHDATFDFNTLPAAGAPFLAASGAIDPIRINNPLNGARLLSVVPLSANASRIAARFSMVRAVNNSIQGSFAVDPSRIDMPMLGNGLSLRIHGAKTNDAFSFSTTGPWNASASLAGQLSVREPGGRELLRIGSTAGEFFASVAGNGLALNSLVVSNLPTGLTVTVFPGESFAQQLTLGAAGRASLAIHGDGTFQLTAELGQALQFSGLPTPGLRAGATLSVNQNGLVLSGAFVGGLLGTGTSAQGTLTVGLNGGVSLTGEASIPPQAFGAIQLRGVNTDNLTVRLFHDGYAAPNGARLQVVGVNAELLTLSPFTNRANANFTATVTSGNFTVPGHFQMTSGQMRLSRLSGVVSFEINSPTVTLLPGSQNATTLVAPFNQLRVDTEGRFYADTGLRELNLLGGVKLRGRLELGNEPSSAEPELAIEPAALNFGSIRFGSVTNRTLRLSNVGEAPLIVNLFSPTPAFVPAQTDLSIPVGEFRDVLVQYRPVAAGIANSQIQVLMMPGGTQPGIPVTGEARPVPIFDASVEAVSFGEVPLGSRATRTVVIRNLGVATLVLTNATLSGPFTLSPTLSNRTLQPGERLDLTLTFTPAALGSATGTLTLRANDSPVPHAIPIQTLNAYAERMVRLREGGSTLRGISMLTANIGWAVGDEGAFLRTDNGGRSWTSERAGFSGSFRAVASRNNLVVVAGLEGMAGVSTDGGATWRRIVDPIVTSSSNHWTAVTLMPLSVSAVNNMDPGVSVVFAGFRDGGGLVARENNGPFVQAVTTAAPLNAIASIRPSPTVTPRLVAVGDAGTVVRSTDGGSTWSPVTLSGGFLNLRGVAFGAVGAIDTDADVWVVGDTGSLFTAPGIGGSLSRVFGPTLENFTAVQSGYIVGENGSAYTRLPFLQNAPFVRENPSGAYHFTAQTSNAGGTWLAGEQGQIHFRPNNAPTGPIFTLAPGEVDFGLLPLNRTRTVDVTVFNRGFAPLNVSAITRSGSSAFALSATALTGIPTNSSRTLQVRFTPVSQGDHSAVIEFTHNESTTRYRLPVQGRGQVNTWNLLASPTPSAFRDLQFVTDTTGFAMTGSQIFRTTNRGTNWSLLTASAPSALSRLHFFSGSLGFAVGGDAGRTFPACTNTCASFILRTANGGTTWSVRSMPVSTKVRDLHMVSATTGFAVTRMTDRIFGLDTPGDVLRTVDGGLTWTVRTRPTPLSGVFDGTAIHAITSTTLFAAGNGQVFRSTDAGATWTRVLNLGTTIEDLQFLDLNNGWLVGADGAFRRTTTGGAVSTAWTPQPSFTSMDLRRVHFVSLTTGWIAGSDGVEGGIFRTDNGGTTWVQEFAETITAGRTGPGAVSGGVGGVAYAVNGDGVYRSGPFQPPVQGSAVVPELVDFGVIAIGTNASRAIALRNPGSATINVTSLSLVTEDDASAFRLLTALPISVAPGGSRAISVQYTPPTVARHRGSLVVGTDGYEGTVRCDLVGEAQVFPTTLVFETEPPGMLMNLRQFPARGPASVTVVGESKVPNDVINPFEWRFGTTNTVSVPALQVRDGFEYRFQRWEPAQPESFTIVATNIQATYRAIFVPVRPVADAKGGALANLRSGRGVALQGLQAAGGPPADVPAGPYVRISQASLELPTLGTAAVQGSAFLSSDRFSMALANAPLGNPQVLSVDAGSWLVSFTNNVRFVLRAQTPGVTVLSRPASAPSQALLDVSATRIVAQLTLPQPTPLIPAVVEFGPNTLFAFTNAVAGGIRVSTIRSSGELWLLAKPGGGFAVTQPFNFQASDRPFTNAITTFPATLLDTSLLRVTPGTGARVEVRRDASGVFGVAVNNFNLSLLGGANTLVSGALSGTRMVFTAGRTLAIGSLRYEAQSATSVEWDFNGPAFKATVPAGTLTAPLIPQALTFTSGFTIDTSANFSRKLALPALTFDGIGVNGGGPLDHNFIRFYRENGVTGLELRDRRSFFDSTMKLSVDIRSTGLATGTFTGSFVVRNFLGCESIGIPNLSLQYNNSFRDYQFRQDARLETCLVGTHDFRIRFGTAGAKFCHLVCGDGGCTEVLCLP